MRYTKWTGCSTEYRPVIVIRKNAVALGSNGWKLYCKSNHNVCPVVCGTKANRTPAITLTCGPTIIDLDVTMFF